MCGIAGFVGEYPATLLADMSALLAHRGPDGDGIWHEGHAGLAHRRLAIIDPTAAAAQPMASCAGRYQTVFNGEIYNFRDVAKELRSRGYEFNARSDTAVLAPLYDAYGPAMLDRLHGIFAFAIWDTREQRLFLARDAIGVKPVYYARTPRGLVFASELKALLPVPDLDREIDCAALRDYLVHLWSPGARTPFLGVTKLLPGHAMTAARDRHEIHAWYRPPIAATRTAHQPARSAAATAGELATLLDVAVADQCLSDVPIGAFLSGGVDSSAVVATMAASGHVPAQTYCVGFSGDGLESEGFGDDLAYARLVAKSLGVPLRPIIVEPAQASDIERLVYTLDEPQADPAPLYVSAIAEAARADGIKVLLSGAGGDDLFSGYRRHRVAALRTALGAHLARGIARLASGLAPLARGSSRRRLQRLGRTLTGSDEDFLKRAFEFNAESDALACLAPDARQHIAKGSPGHLAGALARSSGAPLLDRLLDLEMHGFVPDHNLSYTDRAAMAHGVEVRVPLLDTRLVAFASTLAPSLKVRFGSPKWIFKRAVASRLPRPVLARSKTGFGAPVRRWIAGPWRAMAEDILASQSFRERGLFDRRAVQSILDDTIAGRRDGAYLVLALVMMELWLRRFQRPGGIVTPRVTVSAQFLMPGRGGIARVARLCIKALQRQANVNALSVQDHDCGLIGRVGFRPFQASRARFVLANAASILAGRRMLYDFPGTAKAHLPGLRRLSPYAVWIHGTEVWNPPDIRRGYEAAIHQASLVLVNTAYTLRRAETILGPLPHARLCWLATEDDAPPEQPRATDGPPTVLILARIDGVYGRKGHGELISCWPSVVSEVPDARMLIVGDGAGLEDVRQLAAASPVKESIDIRGFVSESEIGAMWQRAHVFAMPSRKEGFGLVYIEAMRCGLPVIASTHDAASEINIDGVTGYNVDLDAPGELGARLIALLKDRERSHAMGRAGFARWHEHFRYSAFERRFVPLVSDFLSSPSRTGQPRPGPRRESPGEARTL